MTEENLTTNNWDNNDNQDDFQSMKEKRGPFLLTLCILSWIMIGFSLISTLFTYLGGVEKLEDSVSIMEDQMSEISQASSFGGAMMESALEMLEKTIENFSAINISTMLALLIGGLGVYMMFNLKKMGFGLYVLYCIAIPAVSIAFLGSSQAVMMSIGINAFISIAFIIMYGVNLKRMTA